MSIDLLRRIRRNTATPLLSLLLIAFAALAANVAHATPAIMQANGAPACSSCHTQGKFTKAEGRAGLAAYLAAQTPICLPPQVLQGNVCVTPPPPTCIAPQVLQGNVCVTPRPPTCIAPQVLQGNVCVTPPPPTCIAPQVLQGNVCVTPPPLSPTCIAPQVLQGDVCVTPPPLPPTCIAPQVLQGDVCVTPPPPTCIAPQVLQGNVCVTPAPTSCSDVDDLDDEHGQELDDDRDHDGNDEQDDDSGKSKKAKIIPTLSAPDHVSVHAGETLTLAVTAFDCASRPLTIIAKHLPYGAALENTVDPQLHMSKGVITWTPDAGSRAQTVEIELKVVADDGAGKPVASDEQGVVINVLPATPAQPLAQNGPVKSNTVVSAGYRSKPQKLTVAGQLLWNRSSNKGDRLAFIKNQTAVISDAVSGVQLGTAAIKRNGKWKTSITIDANSAPCSVDVAVGGVRATQPVKGANCQN
ncbi:hypothetical protein [Methylomicrobium lacus]|uniref:hypothetical protein n=1 Tax=Methylomicrobium lacus TaxID=136992 RepID=UPI00126956A9|nr:hypothetical protein [Methylomicrobium lacus]